MASGLAGANLFFANDVDFTFSQTITVDFAGFADEAGSPADEVSFVKMSSLSAVAHLLRPYRRTHAAVPKCNTLPVFYTSRHVEGGGNLTQAKTVKLVN